MADKTKAKHRSPLAVAVCCLMLLSLWAWLEARTLASSRDSYVALVGQVEQMQADMIALRALRTAPRRATERERPNHELLAEVRQAMDKADMAPERWVGSDPSQPVRIPKSPYKKLRTRLTFENVTLQELVAVAFHLVEADPALTVSSIRITAPPTKTATNWNAELTLSYLIYSPFRKDER